VVVVGKRQAPETFPLVVVGATYRVVVVVIVMVMVIRICILMRCRMVLDPG